MRRKHFCTLLLLFIVIGLTSCSNDKNNPEKLIIGKWNIIEIEVNNTGFLENGMLQDFGIASSADCIFKEDGSCTVCFRNSLCADGKADGKYTVEDDVLRIKDVEVSVPLHLLFENDADLQDLCNAYDFHLGIDKITKSSLKVTGTLMIQNPYYHNYSETFSLKCTMERK